MRDFTERPIISDFQSEVASILTEGQMIENSGLKVALLTIKRTDERKDERVRSKRM